MDRRRMLAYLGVGLVGLAARSRGATGPAAARAHRWAGGIDRLCTDLRRGNVSPAWWQQAVEAELGGLEMERLLGDLDFKAITEGFSFPDLGVNTIRLRQLELAFPGQAFAAKVFGLKRGRAIIPHGHRHMASAHLVLRGELALRQFDKVSEDASHMVIVPTVDEPAPAGSVSSISDDRNNVHWFRATSAHAFTLDLIVTDLGGSPWEVHNIDPAAGEPMAGGLLRVPKLGVREALERYGKSGWEFDF